MYGHNLAITFVISPVGPEDIPPQQELKEAAYRAVRNRALSRSHASPCLIFIINLFTKLVITHMIWKEQVRTLFVLQLTEK